jgi:immune inhibitor A
LFQKNLSKTVEERHLHPSIYKKIIKTRDLIHKNVDHGKFRAEGGLDLDTYQSLKIRWLDQENRIKEKKQQLIDEYGSLEDVPPTIGPCKKIDPVIGTKNALVLLTEFKDKKHTAIYDSEYFKDLLFSKGSNRSMRDYFLEASWNQLDIKGDVSDEWYSTSLNYSEYLDKIPVEGHLPGAQKLVKEAIFQAKNSKKFDFASYAKNGKIDILIVVYAGYGLDNKLDINYIFPHKDSLVEPLELQDGIWADRYALISELPADDLGCFCHEVGHLLGMPDLYKEGYSPVVGGWCLMSLGSYNNNCRTPSHPCAWCKIHLGWAEPKLVGKNLQSYEIPAIIDDKNIYKLEIEGSNGNEYFLLENRQQKGFDEYLPGSGLLIWHVNEKECILQTPNNDPEHFFLTIKESDGRKDLQGNYSILKSKEGDEKTQKILTGDTGDAFPGETLNRTFDDSSNPNSYSYMGLKSGVKVTSISDSSGIMKAEMGVQFPSSEKIQSPKTPIKIISPKFLTLIFPPKPKNPYEKGWDAYFEDLKEKHGLKDFQDGYRSGYLRGYKDAIKEAKK